MDNKYNYLKCVLYDCQYADRGGFMNCCGERVKNGFVKHCTKWELVDPFRLFIAQRREKRKRGTMNG